MTEQVHYYQEHSMRDVVNLLFGYPYSYNIYVVDRKGYLILFYFRNLS